MRQCGTAKKQKGIKQEYQTAKPHKIDLTDNDIGVSMEIISGGRKKLYKVQLEFQENGDENVAEEIRSYLKEKYLEEKIGYIQIERGALQFPDMENEKEDKSR